jgi:excinuclease UvrABC nuclease subunit
MAVFSDEIIAIVRKGADAAQAFESFLSAEIREIDAELTEKAEEAASGHRAEIATLAREVIAALPEQSPFDIAQAIETMAASGGTQALGLLMFAKAIDSDA